MNRKSLNKSEPTPQISLFSEADIPLEQGVFKVSIFHVKNGDEVIVTSMGQLDNGDAPFTRIHSECFTGEVLNSLKCDCKQQLHEAFSSIAREKHGLVIYLRQEGRGIGLGNKIKAYKLQNEGLNTIQANHALGFPTDLRDFKVAAEILKKLGIQAVRLNTNNPDKISSLEKHGIKIAEIIPSLTPVHSHNKEYLETKFLNLGHKLNQVFSDNPKKTKS